MNPTLIAYLAGALISLAALAVKLYWRHRRGWARQCGLTDLMAHLPAAHQIEYDDVDADGSRIRLRILGAINGLDGGRT